MAQAAATNHQQQRRRHANLALAAVVSGLSALALVLRRFPPEQSSFYPRCPFFELTGFLCPGCGGTRALAALANGKLSEALHWNALIVALLPVLAVWGLAAYWRSISGRNAKTPRVPNLAVAMLLFIATIFAIARNYPHSDSQTLSKPVIVSEMHHSIIVRNESAAPR